MKKRVVITGCGIFASNGKGKQQYWQSLQNGTVGYKPITLFETEQFHVKVAGEVGDFEAKDYVGAKGLRSLDRSTKLLISAARLAIDDARFVITDDNTDDVGVSVGTTLGSLKSISDFDLTTLREGPRYTNPALFPNTVINSPASQVSIWNNIQGFNTTISTGFTASLDAMSYSYDFLQLERVKIIFTGGVEELCFPTFYGFHALKFLSGSSDGQQFVNCPFDKRRNGITFGEGACLIAMEDYDHAIKREAHIQGEVLGFGYCFDPLRMYKYNPWGTGLKAAIRDALDNTGLGIKDIDCIYSNANSTIAADKIETQAIKEIFGKTSYKIPVTAVKSMVGETYSVSGAMAFAGALGTLEENFIPPTANYQQKDPDCDLDYVPNTARKVKVNTILIINFGPNGSNTCVILRRFKKMSGKRGNQVAVVTGGSRGIGRAIVLKLAGMGFHIAFNYHHNKDAAQSLENEIKTCGIQSRSSCVDVADFDSVKDWMAQTKEHFGHIDVLVNNAGIIRDKALMMMTEDDWASVIQTNLNGMFNVSRACIVAMMKQKSGRIVNISSITGLIGSAGQTNYAAAKGGINAFTKSLAKEVASFGITVNAVAPGFIETEMLSAMTAEQKKQLTETIPLKRIGTGEDVANCVAFLLGDDARYITGQIIPIDGGLAIR